MPRTAAPSPAEEAALPQIVAALEEDIVFGRLHPRERLVEDSLMARFGVKRHVVRDALAALDRMGLVERRKNVGALVRSFSAREVTELYALRSLLETEAARLIPLPAGKAGVQALAEIQQAHDAAVAAGDARGVFRSNLAFHEALFSMAGHEVLQQAIAEYARRTHAIRFQSLVSAAYRERARLEHWKIIKALRKGDREALVALCAQHLLPSRDAYLAVQQSSGAAAA
ncbi:GntR family transcriptional regulator [Aquincola sp. MAHUQ-54]|uniref:GntR family transcriptional regulator n=1 Tax=Aquincola agrisoli TaxID=3119538 RepID=A0AAW9QCN3_9BURK